MPNQIRSFTDSFKVRVQLPMAATECVLFRVSGFVKQLSGPSENFATHSHLTKQMAQLSIYPSLYIYIAPKYVGLSAVHIYVLYNSANVCIRVIILANPPLREYYKILHIFAR